MPIETIALFVAAMTATIVSMAIACYGGPSLKTGVRWLFLLFVNIVPGGAGTRRREFSTRETVLAAWFLVFAVVFFVSLFFF